MLRFSASRPLIRCALCVLLAGAALGLLSGCDSGGPEPSMEPGFDMTVGSPVNAELKGAAALGSDLSLSGQSVFTLPVGPSGKTATIVQLSEESDQGVVHDLSFMRFGEEPITEGTYEIGPACGDGCGPGGFFPDELFLADYGRATADSLHSYPVESGTVTVDAVTDDGLRGTFTLTSALEVSVSRAEMTAFIDSLRSGLPRDPSEFPTPPPTDLQPLNPAMTIEGSFTATSTQELSEQVPHLGGFGTSILQDTITIGQ